MPSNADLLNPNRKILINGSSLSPKVDADLISVSISEDLEVPSMFELKIVSWDLVKQEVTWADNNLFEIGNAVEIQMGYAKDLKTIITGEITALEPEFSQESVPVLGVRGHDLRHRLLRGNQTKSFLKVKDSEIASQIATSRGLNAKVTDSKVKLEYVLQHNQTDWDFLKTRAERIGYEVVVDKKDLYFRPHKNFAGKVLTLTYRKDLVEFFPRLSSLNQVSQVEVRGWNPQDKEVVVSKAGVGKENSKMGGHKTGSQIIRTFGKSSNTIVDQPMSTKAEADEMALGQFRDISIAYVIAEGSSLGNPDLRIGKVIEVKGIGKRFSGLYYVTTTEHKFSPDQGYQTLFTARRTAT
jgi:phage protein D